MGREKERERERGGGGRGGWLWSRTYKEGTVDPLDNINQ